ncbi:TetR/AcrR family transcriptional regulator [Cryobacterium sp.]|jgi:AcrR family transcriptional regulator|uniref:TetR/AcrR family transcriptional regulator n=1 Tax=Cryobacterium sp. TaxID=1926290 RepID=UPI0026384644|nr:TetR/AcrR family transcriptional regulator [Cryobacterium sp.]MCU1445206.1 tetR family regulatory protein [Cryobacterium sp.]
MIPTVATRKPRGAYAKTAGRRREILEAGMDVFATNGFRSGSIREIAEVVGISQAGLLHHFANKNELLAGVLELRDDRATEYVDLSAPASIDTIRGFVRLIDYNAHQVPGLVELHCVLSAEATSPEHPAHEYFVRRYAWVLSFLTAAFQAVQDAGQLAAGVSPGSAARGMIAMSDGLQVQWLLDRDTVDMAQEIRNYLRPLLAVEL